jgi:cellulose synthase operon protein C
MAADIHGLEVEFAKSPTLGNCIPLCEAYLGAKRFMEAMVVCKKGIKGEPKDPRGRVLLARVYADQGKLPKAEQEITGMLQEFPNNPMGFEMLGHILVQQGRGPEAVPYLQQALGADQDRAVARQLLQQLGVQMATQPAAPPPMPQAAPPMMPGQGRPPVGAPPGYPPATARPPMPGTRPPAMPQVAQGWQQPAQSQQPPAAWAPPQGVPGMQEQGAPAAPAAEPAQKLEHVSDFFAEEALGFSHDASESGLETAGPGRLTILGFVPKSTGSIKTTIFVALGVFAIAAVLIFWQYYSAQNTRRINKLYGALKSGMDEDRYNRYRDALRDGEEILKIDKGNGQALGAMAYIYAILGGEHREEGALNKAKELLKRADESGDKETEFRVAARALIRFFDKDYDKGIAEVKDVIDKGGSGPMVELEAFRLMNATKPDDRDTQKQLARLRQILVSQVRAFNFLGWYFYGQEDWAQADRYFDQAKQNSKDHPVAIIGQSLTDLDRGIGLRERQADIASAIKKAFALPKEEYSPPVLALAHFVRAQLLQWQGKLGEAEADYKEAFKLDPANPMFYYRRGIQQLKIGMIREAVENLRKAAQADPNNPRYYKKLGEAQMKAGDFSGAKASFDRAGQFASKDPELKLLAGDRLRGEKKFDEAIATYKSIGGEELNPDLLVQAQIGISQAYRDSNRKPLAIQQIEGFMEKAPNMGPEMAAKIWCELGQTYEQTKNKEKATQCYDIGIEQFRFYPDCHFFKCRLIGKGDEAKEACKLYLALDPRGQFAEEALKRAGPLSPEERGANPPKKGR